MGPSRRTLKNFLTKIQWGKGHQPADRTLRTPKLLCGRAVCFYWDRTTLHQHEGRW